MGIIRSVVVVVSIIVLVMLVSHLMLMDLYLVAGLVIASIYILGVVVGFAGGIKLLPRKTSVENDNKKAISSLVGDINKAHKTIRIVGGTANPKVYNDERVKNAFKNAIQRGVKIQTVFSFTGTDLNKADNTIIKLAKEGMIELYLPNRDKVPINHFRVMDKISVYSEKEHASDDVHRFSERFDNSSNISNRFEKAFDTIISNSSILSTTL